MSVTVSLDQIVQLAPNVQASYRQAFQSVQSVLDRGAISASPLRVAHFLAQVMHESGGLSILYESLNYSAARLPAVWPSRFKPSGPNEPNDFAHHPEQLADLVYGGRMGNRAPGDGYLFRGRGLLQLTGRDAYAAGTSMLRALDTTAPDLLVDPDVVVGAAWSLELAAAVWVSKGCNAMADRDDLAAVTRAINGGLIGLDERGEWLSRCKHVWH